MRRLGSGERIGNRLEGVDLETRRAVERVQREEPDVRADVEDDAALRVADPGPVVRAVLEDVEVEVLGLGPLEADDPPAVRQFELLERRGGPVAVDRRLGVAVDRDAAQPVDLVRELGHGRPAQERPERERDRVHLVQLRDDLDPDERVPAEVDEVVVAADALDPERPRPDRGDHLLRVALRGRPLARDRARRRRQRLPVDLARRRRRELVHVDDRRGGRDHVAG